MAKCPVAFIDRDGTINIDGGYINHPQNFIIYPFAAQAIRMLNMAGWRVIVVTNQSGVGRGFYTEEMMNTLNNNMIQTLASYGAVINAVYCCPHDMAAKDERYRIDCDCRKPKPGMLLQAIEDQALDTSKAVMIGDKYSDMQAGFAAGCKGIMVKTGYGRGDLEAKSVNWARQPDYIAENLLEAVKISLSLFGDSCV